MKYIGMLIGNVNGQDLSNKPERLLGAVQAVVDDRIVKISTDPARWQPELPPLHACARGVGQIERLYHPERLQYPMRRVGPRGAGQFERISWDEALDHVATEMLRIRRRYGNAAFVDASRSGNTSTPDESWSDWSAPLAAPGKVTSPAARFVQLRARWKGDGAASVRGIGVAYVTDNLRAIVTEVNTAKGPAAPTPPATPVVTPQEPTRSSAIKISWKTDNPDGDSLRYRLWFRREESPLWRPITRDDEPIATSDLVWPTEALAEGWYRVRVEASDELANPVGQALKHALDSAPFVVDNTPPVIQPLAIAQGRLQGTVTDGVGPIARLEVQIDGKGAWRPITSADGILDEATERIDAPLGIQGSHVVALRAFDQAGNQVTREVESK